MDKQIKSLTDAVIKANSNTSALIKDKKKLFDNKITDYLKGNIIN